MKGIFDDVQALNKKMIGPLFKLKKHRPRAAEIAYGDPGGSRFLRRETRQKAIEKSGKPMIHG
jgi:hypothetical protein